MGNTVGRRRGSHAHPGDAVPSGLVVSNLSELFSGYRNYLPPMSWLLRHLTVYALVGRLCAACSACVGTGGLRLHGNLFFSIFLAWSGSDGIQMTSKSAETPLCEVRAACHHQRMQSGHEDLLCLTSALVYAARYRLQLAVKPEASLFLLLRRV